MNIDNIPTNMSRLIISINLHASKISKITGIPAATIKNYTNGYRQPLLAAVIKMSEAFGATNDDERLEFINYILTDFNESMCMRLATRFHDKYGSGTALRMTPIKRIVSRRSIKKQHPLNWVAK